MRRRSGKLKHRSGIKSGIPADVRPGDIGSLKPLPDGSAITNEILHQSLTDFKENRGENSLAARQLQQLNCLVIPILTKEFRKDGVIVQGYEGELNARESIDAYVDSLNRKSVELPRLSGLSTSVHELAFNCIQHTDGGLIVARPKDGRFELIYHDEGEGIENPEEKRQRGEDILAFYRKLSEDEPGCFYPPFKGKGMYFITDGPDEVTLETRNEEWKIVDNHFVKTGESPVKGTKFTLVWLPKK